MASRFAGLLLALGAGCQGVISDSAVNRPGVPSETSDSPSAEGTPGGPGTTDPKSPGMPGSKPAGPGSGGTAGSGSEPVAACDATLRGLSEAEMRRLTTPEIVRSLGEVFGAAMDAPEVTALIPTLPSEPTVTADRTFDNKIQDVEGLEALAQTLAHRIVSDASLSRSILDCNPASELPKCQTTLLDRLARRLFRRPLAAAERDGYTAFMTEIGGVDGLEFGIVRAIVSPHFHQHLELESTPADNGRRRVDSFAVASRVSFALTGAVPDESLLAAAEQGALNELPRVREQALRLMNTDAARTRVKETLLEWIHVTPPDPSSATAAALKIDGVGLGQEAQRELDRFIEYVVFDQRGTFQDLWKSDMVFPFTDRLATLFGVSRADGPVKGQTPRGMFLRPASLLTSANDTSPILRGATMRRSVLCEVFPTPDPKLVAEGNAIRDSLPAAQHSGRARAEAATAQTFCGGCHARINAMGFVLENFGPLGEWRERQNVVDASGKAIASFPVDSSVDDMYAGDVGAVANASELGPKLAVSEVATRCFAERLFVSSRLRKSSDADDCLMRQLVEVAPDAPVLEVYVDAIVNEDVFYRAEVTP